MPGWLGSWESPEELHQYIMSERSFPCHLTMLDGDEERKPDEDMKLCKGALLYMHKSFKVPYKNPEVTAAFNECEKDDKSNILSTREFIAHHS